jgi:glycosyltransferase involved in cell wall biosynthesis
MWFYLPGEFARCHRSPLLRLPVIGSNKGGIPELVEHQKNGLLIKPGDAESHRDTLETVLNNPSLLGTWRNYALSSASKFAPDGLVDRL